VRPHKLALVVVAGLGIACGDRGAPASEAGGASSSSAASPAAPDKSTDSPPTTTAPAKPARHDQPLPAFEGTTLQGERLSVSSLLGKRLVLFFFNPELPEAAVMAKALVAISGLRGDQNFEIVGIGMGGNRSKLDAFVREQGLNFRVIDDTSGAIAQKLGLQVPVAVVGADAEGYVTFGLGGFASDVPDAPRVAETQLRSDLRLPPVGAQTAPELGEHPKAPDFTAERLEGGERFHLAALRGKPVLLVFFLHTCPHCHHALSFLKTYLPTIPEDKRPVLVGVSVSDRIDAVRETLRSDGLDFFPVLVDLDYKIREVYGAMAGVPDLFLISADGKIEARTEGWRDDRDPPLMKMRIAKLAGISVPMLLNQNGYSGNEFCAVCHEAEKRTWELTHHADAFHTLVTHGADKDPECVSCHVVGFGKPDGYTISPPAPSLEDVGCESCHGRGGPHLSPGLVKDGNYEPQCLHCHDPQHSLGFKYADFLPRISHAANAKLASLPLEEKRKILLARGRPRDDLLPTTAAYVGSQACQSCHPGEYDTWSKSPHARAIDALSKQNKSADSACLKCHTTGFGRTGGFPVGEKLDAHPGLIGVGCESCHGPGGDHVKEGSTKVGTIVSLGDKCDSCVILQICGSCHDAANDAGFEFQVKKKIEAQKHGTKEPAAGKGAHKESAAQDGDPASARIAALERAFAALDARGG
jgi:peroxiredoxin